MPTPKLYMLLLGATPQGRTIEQHDIFFGIAASLKELVPAINEYWADAVGKIHIDAYREVSCVDGYKVEVRDKDNVTPGPEQAKLFFINLGGYKPGDFEEYHYKMIIAAADKGSAIRRAKNTAFYKHTGYKGAESHIDDKFGIDVDNIHEIPDILSPGLKQKYRIVLSAADNQTEDELHIGYFKLDKI